MLSDLGASGAGWSSAHDQVEGLGQGDVTPVCEGRDDQPGGVAEVLVAVAELGVADVAEGSPAPDEMKHVEKPPLQDELEAQVEDLMGKGMFERANGVALVMLEGYRAKGDKMAAASFHNLLGEIYSAQEQYREAARSYVQALALALPLAHQVARRHREELRVRLRRDGLGQEGLARPRSKSVV